MHLDPEVCYRAVSSRDRRFDGKFFIGVRTTQIYCRPICPAPHAKRANMVFLPSAAAAIDAGFRPCLRCFPEYSPRFEKGSPSSGTVSRALKLIAAGALEEIGVSGLADRLEISERHLRRLFAAQLGTTPLAVAQTRRIHLAKQLINDTDLSMTRIAFAAGYPSIRQFNNEIKKRFGRPPRELRKRSEKSKSQHCFFELKLHYRPPFNWESLLRFLAPRSLAGIECVEDSTYRRWVTFGDQSGIVEVQNVPDQFHLRMKVPIELWKQIPELIGRIETLFDLAADPAAIVSHLGSDDLLAEFFASTNDVRVPGCWDPFELAVRTILGQQVSVAAATTLATRLIQKWGTRIDDGELGWVFPKPRKMARADVASIGLPKSRAKSIVELAKAMERGWLPFDGTLGTEEFCTRLTSLPGIGDWTASYIAMRGLKDPNSFPAGDLGIKNVLQSLDRSSNWTERQIRARAEAWQPWRAYAAMAMWLHLGSGSSK